MKSLFLHTNLSNVDSKFDKLQSSFSNISSVSVLESSSGGGTIMFSSSGGGTIMFSSTVVLVGESGMITSSNTSFRGFGGGLGSGVSSARIFSSTRISQKY